MTRLIIAAMQRKMPVLICKGSDGNPFNRCLGTGKCLRFSLLSGQRNKVSLFFQKGRDIIHCRGNEQPFSCSCEGYIQKPQFLRQRFALEAKRDCFPRQCRVLHQQIVIHYFGAKPKLRMDENRFKRILQIEPSCSITEKNHRKFQPFGAVDTHYVHSRIFTHTCRGNGILIFQFFQIADKTMKAVITVLFKTGSKTEHLHQVGKSSLSIRHGTAYSKDIRAVQDHPNDFLGSQIRCSIPESIQHCKKLPGFVVFAGINFQGVIKSGIFVCSPYCSKLIPGKADCRRRKHREQCNLI